MAAATGATFRWEGVFEVRMIYNDITAELDEDGAVRDGQLIRVEISNLVGSNLRVHFVRSNPGRTVWQSAVVPRGEHSFPAVGMMKMSDVGSLAVRSA